MNGSLISRLNATATALGINNRVIFHAETAEKTVAELAPCGTVAIIYFKQTFSDIGALFSARLKALGVKPLNFIMPDFTALNADNVFDVIGVPESVRAVICFDNSLASIAAYVSTVFKIPFVYIPRTIETEGILCPKTAFYWGKNSELVTTDCVFHVVINFPDGGFFTGEKVFKQYENLITKIAALTDYRVKLALTGEKADRTAYAVIKQAVLNAFCSQEKTDLFLAGLNVEMANLASGGKIICNSAEYSFKRLNGFFLDEGVTIAFLDRLLRFYALCAEKGSHPFFVPDYNKRAAELSRFTGLDDGVYLKGFIDKKRVLRKNSEVTRVKQELKNELVAQASVLNEIKRTYISLGGKPAEDFSPCIFAFKHCGDLPETFNFMTLVQDAGFCESF